jgi:predicted dinucleotide-binding enzyme
MGYKAFACMNIAIIGKEKMSVVLAQGLALAGHQILIGIKEEETITFDFLVDEFENIHVVTVEEAAAEADLIIMATSPEQVREMAYLLDDVRKKVIIDSTFMSIEGEDQYLNTVQAIKAITGSQHVVKCFNAAGFEPQAAVKGRDNVVQMFLAGDDRKSKETARVIARDLGFAECHDFGGIDSVPLLDEMAICHYNLSTRKAVGEKVAITIMKH